MAGIAPELTSASIALNTSAIYFGQAAGAMATLPWVGAGVLLAAAAVSAAAMRYERSDT